jgi:hypothetical protein
MCGKFVVHLLLASPPFLVAAELPAVEIDVTFVTTDRRTLERDEQAAIEEIAVRAISEAAKLLPGLPDRIELEVVSGSAVIPGFGSGGMAPAPGKIQWTVDPDIASGPIEIAGAELRTTMFHESHHLARGWTVSGGTAGFRMIDAAVAEGMATAFERDAGGGDPPWGNYPPDEAAGWVEELLAVKNGPQAYGTWMFSHPDGRRWIGYRAGTYLTDRAMAACGCSAADLASRSTDEVLELAR